MKMLIHTIILGFIFCLAVIPAYAGDPIIGCPIGVEKGKVWLMGRTFYSSATKAYWNEDPSEEPQMVSMPEGWHAKILKSSYRTGFGITDRISLGMLLTYWDKDISKQVWKQKPDSTWMKKSVSFRAHGFGDIWLYGLYKVIKDHPTFEAISVGAGYKLDAADNSLVVHGIGTGTKDARIALLTHDNLFSIIHLCTSIWYENRGKIRYIEVKNDQGDMVEWEKSGNDIGDAFGYSLAVELPIDKNGHYEIVPALAGWNKFADEDKNGVKIENTDFYQHYAGLMFRYLPLGEECEHCKFTIGGKIPIAAVNSFAPSVSIQVGAMWTF